MNKIGEISMKGDIAICDISVKSDILQTSLQNLTFSL